MMEDGGGRTRGRGLTIVRRSVQAAFLLLFGLLAFATAYPPLKLPAANLMLRLDPLAAVYSSIATHDLSVIASFWPAWVLLGLTLASSRFFCGWICPLGTCFDALGALKPKALEYYRPKGRRMREMKAEAARADGSPARRKLAWLRPKYMLLALVLVLALAKINLLFFASPLVIMSNTAYYILLPGIPFLFVGLMLVAFFYRPRYWCESLCPAGALMSLTSLAGKKLPASLSPLSVVKEPDACIDCGACYKRCDFGVEEPFTSARTGRLRSSDCTACGDCVGVCPAAGALALDSIGQGLYVSSGKRLSARAASRSKMRGSVTPPAEATDTQRRFAISRGEFIGSMGLGAVLLAGYGVGLPKTDQSVLRMPGAQDESAFLARCNRCLACARTCPTGCLKPMGIDSGFQKLWTPRFVPREAGCIFEQCEQACQQVCPAGAIDALKPDEVFIGTAKVNKQTCLGWRGKSCIVCIERCRFNAIEVSGLRPRVIEEKCTGCGACEETCPTQQASIKVFPPGQQATWQTSGGGGNRRR